MFTTAPAKPLAFYMRKALVKAALITALIVQVVLYAHMFGTHDTGSVTIVAPEAPAAPAKGSPEALLAAHDCWTGEAPADMAGKFPGHVVYAHGATPRVGGTRMVGMALDQLFDGKDNGLTVYGFCR